MSIMLINQSPFHFIQAFGKGGSGDVSTDLLDLNLVSKQQNSALRKAEISPKEFTKVRHS